MKEKIIQYLKQISTPVHKGELERLAIQNQWGEAETVGRRCRELVNSGVILRLSDPKGRAVYKFNFTNTLF